MKPPSGSPTSLASVCLRSRAKLDRQASQACSCCCAVQLTHQDHPQEYRHRSQITSATQARSQPPPVPLPGPPPPVPSQPHTLSHSQVPQHAVVLGRTCTPQQVSQLVDHLSPHLCSSSDCAARGASSLPRKRFLRVKKSPPLACFADDLLHGWDVATVEKGPRAAILGG